MEIVFDVPEEAELLGEADCWRAYAHPDGDYAIAARTIAAADLDEAVYAVSGYSVEELRAVLHEGEGRCSFGWYAPETDGGVNIVATVFPAYDFARQIAGDDGNVTLLIPPGSEAHSYEPTPQDIIRIQNCDLLVCNGGEVVKPVFLDKVAHGEAVGEYQRVPLRVRNYAAEIRVQLLKLRAVINAARRIIG